MIDFLLEVTGIKWLQRLHDRWVVGKELERIMEEERLFQENLKNLWQQTKDDDES